MKAAADTEIDQDWLLEWSLSQKDEQRRRGGYYFGPIYTFKPVDTVCDDQGDWAVAAHDSCLDAAARSGRGDLNLNVVVQIYSKDGSLLRTEFLHDE